MNKKQILQQAASTLPVPAADFGALAQLPVAESMAAAADFATLINLCLGNRQMHAACQQDTFWDAFVARFPSEQELFNHVEEPLYIRSNMPSNVPANQVNALLLRFIMAARKAGKAPFRSDVMGSLLSYLLNDRGMARWSTSHKASNAQTAFRVLRTIPATEASKNAIKKELFTHVVNFQNSPVLWAEVQYLLHKLGEDLRSITMSLDFGNRKLMVNPLQHALLTNNADGLVESVKAARLIGRSAKDIRRDIDNQLRYLNDKESTLPASDGTNGAMEDITLSGYANIMSPAVANALFEFGMRAELASMGF